MTAFIRLAPLLFILSMSTAALAQKSSAGEKDPANERSHDVDNDSVETSLIDKFLTVFPPDGKNKPVSTSQLRKYDKRLPASIIELWKRGGFGNYGRGEIKIVNPDDYEKTLMGWLMRNEVDDSRTVVALSSFGTIFYHRQIDDEVDDVSFLDPHTSTSGVVSFSGEGFVSALASDETGRKQLLKTSIFNDLTRRHGEIPATDIFYYVPALRLGGSGSLDSIEHGDAEV